MAGTLAARAAAAPRAPYVRTRTEADRRGHARALQHFSGRRRRPVEVVRTAMPISDLNALPEDTAVAELLHCCGSTQWARRMAAARPLPSLEAMSMTADKIWA